MSRHQRTRRHKPLPFRSRSERLGTEARTGRAGLCLFVVAALGFLPLLESRARADDRAASRKAEASPADPETGGEGRAPDAPLGTVQGERIVILGGGFAERLQHFGYFETLLLRHAGTWDPIVRNMAWSGDTVALMPRPYNFIRSAGTGAPDDPSPSFNTASDPDSDHRILTAHLAAQKPDTILLCFGAVEAFGGSAELEKFAADYQRLIDHLLEQRFNGKTPPTLILVSPIAQEKLGEPFSDPAERNADLERYTETIAGIAERNDLFYVDLFGPTFAAMNRADGEALTIDGLQLNAHGQRVAAEALAAGLGITAPWSGEFEPLRELVIEKNRQFFYRWRPINGEYVYGRRREPFGVVSYPPEMEQLDEVIAGLEERIHAEAGKLASGRNQP